MNICCYLLVSENTHCTYVGYTTNITKRLLQHNGLKSGGAVATKYNRPWKLKMKVTGFISETQARQLEFNWKRSNKSRLLKDRETKITELLSLDKFKDLILHQF